MPDQLPRDTWVEHEGEVVPSYTGVNAPRYPGVDKEGNLETLEDMHGDIAAPKGGEALEEDPVDPAVIINSMRSGIPQPRRRVILHNPLDGATAKYINGREKYGPRR